MLIATAMCSYTAVEIIAYSEDYRVIRFQKSANVHGIPGRDWVIVNPVTHELHIYTRLCVHNTNWVFVVMRYLLKKVEDVLVMLVSVLVGTVVMLYLVGILFVKDTVLLAIGRDNVAVMPVIRGFGVSRGWRALLTAYAGIDVSETYFRVEYILLLVILLLVVLYLHYLSMKKRNLT